MKKLLLILLFPVLISAQVDFKENIQIKTNLKNLGLQQLVPLGGESTLGFSWKPFEYGFMEYITGKTYTGVYSSLDSVRASIFRNSYTTLDSIYITSKINSRYNIGNLGVKSHWFHGEFYNNNIGLSGRPVYNVYSINSVSFRSISDYIEAKSFRVTNDINGNTEIAEQLRPEADWSRIYTDPQTIAFAYGTPDTAKAMYVQSGAGWIETYQQFKNVYRTSSTGALNNPDSQKVYLQRVYLSAIYQGQASGAYYNRSVWSDDGKTFSHANTVRDHLNYHWTTFTDHSKHTIYAIAKRWEKLPPETQFDNNLAHMDLVLFRSFDFGRTFWLSADSIRAMATITVTNSTNMSLSDRIIIGSDTLKAGTNYDIRNNTYQVQNIDVARSIAHYINNNTQYRARVNDYGEYRNNEITVTVYHYQEGPAGNLTNLSENSSGLSVTNFSGALTLSAAQKYARATINYFNPSSDASHIMWHVSDIQTITFDDSNKVMMASHMLSLDPATDDPIHGYLDTVILANPFRTTFARLKSGSLDNPMYARWDMSYPKPQSTWNAISYCEPAVVFDNKVTYLYYRTQATQGAARTVDDLEKMKYQYSSDYGKTWSGLLSNNDMHAFQTQPQVLIVPRWRGRNFQKLDYLADQNATGWNMLCLNQERNISPRPVLMTMDMRRDFGSRLWSKIDRVPVISDYIPTYYDIYDQGYLKSGTEQSILSAAYVPLWKTVYVFFTDWSTQDITKKEVKIIKIRN